MGDAEGAPPVMDGGGAQPVNPERPAAPMFDLYAYVCNFMAQNGWYMVFGFVLFCIIKKNLDSYFQRLRDWWAVAAIKKDPDQFIHLEEDRMSRIERLQRELDAKAAAKKARQDEIDAERKEREEAARINGGGKETMARWEEEKKKKNEPEASTANTLRKGAVPSGLKDRILNIFEFFKT